LGRYSFGNSWSYCGDTLIYLVMDYITGRKILLVLIASLLLVTFVKVMLSQPDFLDRLLALLAVIVFFIEQLTR